DVQTTLVAPGGATMVEFKADYPGKYILVDHSLSRLEKGLAGCRTVTGEADAEIFSTSEKIDANSGHCPARRHRGASRNGTGPPRAARFSFCVIGPVAGTHRRGRRPGPGRSAMIGAWRDRAHP